MNEKFDEKLEQHLDKYRNHHVDNKGFISIEPMGHYDPEERKIVVDYPWLNKITPETAEIIEETRNMNDEEYAMFMYDLRKKQLQDAQAKIVLDKTEKK